MTLISCFNSVSIYEFYYKNFSLAISFSIAIIREKRDFGLMNVLSYLKDLYTKENSLLNHITLFALLGICAISTVGYLSYSFANIFSWVTSIPSQKAYILLVFALMTIFFFCGYVYSFANNVFQNKTALPELELSSYSAFVRTLPVLISWYIYEAFLMVVGFVTVPATNHLFYVYYSVFLCILPFINLISIAFAKDFKLRPALFSFLTLFKVLNQTLGDVIKLFLQIVLLLIIPAGLVYLMFKYSAGITQETLKFSVNNIVLCIATYLMMVVKLVYTRGLVEIVKDKLANL